MENKDLLKQFTNKFPGAAHPKDEQRFAKYVVDCIKNGIDVDWGLISQKVSERRLEQLHTAAYWIELAIRYKE